jgi:restriction system protein
MFRMGAVRSITPGARDYAAKVPSRLVLIDGERLASLMIKHGVGAQVVRSYNVVEFFE